MLSASGRSSLEWDTYFDGRYTKPADDCETVDSSPELQVKKRKRINTPGEPNKTQTTTKPSKLEKGLEKLNKCLIEAEKFVKENKNVHVPMKRAVENFRAAWRDIHAAKEKLDEEVLKRENKTLVEENENLRQALSKGNVTEQLKTEELKNEIKTLKSENERLRNLISNLDNNTQANSMVATIAGEISYDRLMDLMNKPWTNEVYQRTETTNGSPLQTKDHVIKVVIIEPTDQQMNKSIQRAYRERYPELATATGDFAVLEQTTYIRHMNNREKVMRKLVKLEYDGSTQDLWDKILQLKEEVVSAEWVALHHVDILTVTQFRKMVELAFMDTEVKIIIYTNRDTKETEQKKSPKERKTYAIVVDQGEEEYRALLQKNKKLLKRFRSQ